MYPCRIEYKNHLIRHSDYTYLCSLHTLYDCSSKGDFYENVEEKHCFNKQRTHFEHLPCTIDRFCFQIHNRSKTSLHGYEGYATL